MRRLALSDIVILFLVIVLGSVFLFWLSSFWSSPTTISETVGGVKTTQTRGYTTLTGINTKTPVIQLTESASRQGYMAVVVMTGLRPSDIIPANTIIEIRVVTKDGVLLLSQTAMVRRNLDDYEFVITPDKYRELCQGRPLYVSLKMETPSEIYSYQGILPEWRGIADMCLPFTR
jgi:hypothetical protein